MFRISGQKPIILSGNVSSMFRISGQKPFALSGNVCSMFRIIGQELLLFLFKISRTLNAADKLCTCIVIEYY